MRPAVRIRPAAYYKYYMVRNATPVISFERKTGKITDI
jgi:hypothetical protein